jgi:hypothetical protein
LFDLGHVEDLPAVSETTKKRADGRLSFSDEKRLGALFCNYLDDFFQNRASPDAQALEEESICSLHY